MSDQREAVPESKRKIYGRWVNGFFESVKPTGAFAQELREAGYDAAQPAGQYPVRTFYNLMEVTRRHLFPSLPVSEGHRKLGRRLVTNQFERGIGGKLWAKAFPLIGPDRFLKGVEQLTHFGGDSYLEAKARKEGDRHWRLTFRRTVGAPPEFFAGCLEYALDLARTPPGWKVVVASFDAAKDEFDLEITW